MGPGRMSRPQRPRMCFVFRDISTQTKGRWCRLGRNARRMGLRMSGQAEGLPSAPEEVLVNGSPAQASE